MMSEKELLELIKKITKEKLTANVLLNFWEIYPYG